MYNKGEKGKMVGKDHKSEVKKLEKSDGGSKKAKGKPVVIKGEGKKVSESILRT